jgi:hypothetical protein
MSRSTYAANAPRSGSARGLRQGGTGFAQAVTLAIIGEHLVRYTQEVVLPRLDRALAAQERDVPVPARTPTA